MFPSSPFAIDISDASIEVLKLKKSLGKTKFVAAGRLELPEGLVVNGEIRDQKGLAEKIREILRNAKPKTLKDRVCYSTLPETKVFTHVLEITSDVAKQALVSAVQEKASELTPYSFEEILFDFKVKELTKAQKVLFSATTKQTAQSFYQTFVMAGVTPKVFESESLACARAILNSFPKKPVLIVDLGTKTDIFSIFDKDGLCASFNEPKGGKQLVDNIKEKLNFYQERVDKRILKIILVGGGSLGLKPEEITQELKVEVIFGNEAVGKKLSQFGEISFLGQTPPVLFANVLGLALRTIDSYTDKEGINLARDVAKILIRKEIKMPKKAKGETQTDVEEPGAEKKPEIEKEEVKEEKTEEKPVSEETVNQATTNVSPVRQSFDKSEEELVQGKEKAEEELEQPQGRVLKIDLEVIKRFALPTLIVLILSGIIFLGIKFFSSGKKPTPTPTSAPTPAVVVSPSPEVTPETSPAAKLKREDLKIQVLNGCGIAGAAGKAKEFLEGLGYKDIEAGNADSYDYEETEVSIKEDKESYLELLTDDLSEEYALSAGKKTIDKDDEFDVIVVIGKE